MEKYYLHSKSSEILLLDNKFSNESEEELLKLYSLNKNKKVKFLDYGYYICLKKDLFDLDFILNKIIDFKFEYSYGNIHIINDIYLDYDFIIDEIKDVQGGSVNTGFGIEYELLKDVSYDVEFYFNSETKENIYIPNEWLLEIKKQLIISYE